MMLPLQGAFLVLYIPGALPWANRYWPFDKFLTLGQVQTSLTLLSFNRNFQAESIEPYEIDIFFFHEFYVALAEIKTQSLESVK